MQSKNLMHLVSPPLSDHEPCEGHGWSFEHSALPFFLVSQIGSSRLDAHSGTWSGGAQQCERKHWVVFQSWEHEP